MGLTQLSSLPPTALSKAEERAFVEISQAVPPRGGAEDKNDIQKYSHPISLFQYLCKTQKQIS